MNLLLFMRHHPLVIVTLSYIAGITLSFNLILPNQVCYILLFITGAVVMLTILFTSKYDYHTLTIFFFMAGCLNGGLVQAIPESPHHIYTQMDETEDSIVLGTIQRVFGFNGRTSKFDVSVLAKRTAQTEFKTVHGIIRYTIEGPLPAKIIPGKTFAIRSKLRKPNKYATPGSFDYPEYLARKGIFVTSFIHSSLYLQPVQSEQSPFYTFVHAPEVLRTKINSFIDYHLTGDNAAIYKALLTGDRSSIPKELIESFKGSGCLHILAISGIHMSLLGLVLYSCFFWLLRRSTWLIHRINTKKTAVFLCIVPLLFYTFIAGAKTPVIRSFIMSLVVIVAICFGKKHTFASLVALAALVVLVLSPAELFTPSFQLTFAAVISIAAAFPIITKTNTALRNRFSNQYIINAVTWISASLVVSTAATLGTAPLVVFHFNMISLVGIIANLIIEPLLCLWSLTIGFIATAFIFISPILAEFFFRFGGKGISLAVYVADFFYSLPFSFVMLPTVSIFQIVLYYICLLLLIQQKLLKDHYRIIVFAIFLATIAFAIMPLNEILKGHTKESTISFLDVGHGSCTLIETAGGKRIIIDGGALTSPGFDIGKRVITPFLLKKKILTIDDIIITHADSDHYNGVVSLLKQFKVKNLWVNSKKRHDHGWEHLLETAAALDVRIVVPKTNDIIVRNAVMSIQVIANTTDTHALSADNDNGLIVRYRHGQFSVLFPGDISTNMERKLIDSDSNLKATILLAAHHGSATSNSTDFLKSIQPELLVVSSGRKKNTFPSTKVMTRCNKLGIPVITTHISGTVSIIANEEEYDVETFYPEQLTKNRPLNTLTHR